MNKILKEFCCGCKLCLGFANVELIEDEKGFVHPEGENDGCLKKVCPCFGAQIPQMDSSMIWGRYLKAYLGWSSDDAVRFESSSGGVLTEVACFLLRTQRVDYIIQTCADPTDPTKTVTQLSSTEDEVKQCSGSRYSISHPLSVLSRLDLSKKYALIGKPCDITAFRNYSRINPDIKNSIIYTLSFFCAGLPSKQAQEKLLKELGVSNRDLVSLQYRGKGWPGYAIGKDRRGVEYSIDYNSSWSKILGRDTMKFCRFCLDGIGELADISCGDAWYLDQEKMPDFREKPGRNIVFARTQVGLDILQGMAEDQCVSLRETSLTDLRFIQSYQFERRGSMRAKMMAMRLCGKPVPHYDKYILTSYQKSLTFRKRLRFFLGTVKRVLQNKI